ncbi:hypothetical protein N7462_004568 [Penicillium macrosclerotiorum]|uniref:uncharacterized protein n=1 Tax=Penicillium macrosclerotiorum TaxID=303699 RepID=UPI002546D98C|nr:uncharacterized protein N7462_004568 [Penicillium macrosclerotiorum]KAJ5690176.1 hypothetical protein N7462_004568 [Penicillium macrosclerotiorum]
MAELAEAFGTPAPREDSGHRRPVVTPIVRSIEASPWTLLGHRTDGGNLQTTRGSSKSEAGVSIEGAQASVDDLVETTVVIGLHHGWA